MYKKGLTLVELILTMVIALVVATSVTVLFIAEFRLRKKMDDQITVAREAQAIIDHTSRVLRFVRSETNDFTSDISENVSIYTAVISEGHLKDLLPREAVYFVQYFYMHDFPDMTEMENRVSFCVMVPNIDQEIPAADIGWYVKDFSIVEEAGREWFTVSVTTQKNDSEITLTTTIKRIG